MVVIWLCLDPSYVCVWKRSLLRHHWTSFAVCRLYAAICIKHVQFLTICAVLNVMRDAMKICHHRLGDGQLQNSVYFTVGAQYDFQSSFRFVYISACRVFDSLWCLDSTNSFESMINRQPSSLDYKFNYITVTYTLQMIKKLGWQRWIIDILSEQNYQKHRFGFVFQIMDHYGVFNLRLRVVRNIFEGTVFVIRTFCVTMRCWVRIFVLERD